MKVYIRRNAPSAQETRLHAFAHDIRTPMCCVTGAAQLAMLGARQGRDVSEQMEQILLAVSAMDRMLTELCGAGKREKAALFTQEMLTRELLAIAGEAARREDRVLSVDLTALGNRAFAADYAALTRVLTNLLLNAIKYTRPGGVVSLRAEIDQEEAEKLHVRFIVADNGVGMKPEFLERLFLPFERAAETAHLPGKGLGLSIARRLTERMGGEISVKSQWGKGTTFTVTVPLMRERSQDI